MPLHHRVALVTGATGLLGSAVLPALRTAGASVAIPYLATPPGNGTPAPASAGPPQFAAKADLFDEEQVKVFVQMAAAALGPIELLVNLAGGYVGGKTLEEHSPEEWDRMMDLNVRTAFLAIRETLPSMKQRGFGRIVNVSAMPAIRSGAGRIPYAVSKRAVIGLTEGLADELKGTGITVNAVAPSVLLAPGESGTGVTAAEVAAMIVHLCSPDAGGVSGNVIRLFGGM